MSNSVQVQVTATISVDEVSTLCGKNCDYARICRGFTKRKRLWVVYGNASRKSHAWKLQQMPFVHGCNQTTRRRCEVNKIFKALAYLWNRFSIVELALALFVIGMGFQLCYVVAMAWLFHNFIYLMVFSFILAVAAIPLHRAYKLVQAVRKLNDRAR